MKPESFNINPEDNDGSKKNLEIVPDENPVKEAVKQYERKDRVTERLGTQADIDAVDIAQAQKLLNQSIKHEELRDEVVKKKNAILDKIKYFEKEGDHILLRAEDRTAEDIDELLAEKRAEETTNYLDKALDGIKKFFTQNEILRLRTRKENYDRIRGKVDELEQLLAKYEEQYHHHNNQVTELSFQAKQISNRLNERGIDTKEQNNGSGDNQSLAA